MKKLLSILGIFCFAFFFSQKNQNYLQIGYSSICCGTPSKDPVIKYLAQFQKKNKIKNLEILQQGGLGREGEFNLYIGIDALSKTQKGTFIKGLQSAIDAQNKTRQQNSDGLVNLDVSTMVTKADLANKKNVTIYKK
ncbi:hypothetical protein M2347_004037 [Chryseobacterium sp. H1D6B]|uniref:hypothetical protein n=1 Tax=Chryseobacterium sp. H1D6B TaxID=2940588 RepID=UPI0015C7974B|nr:hypothetical protein [Chryseobacterium sp. H1D6B]MDH6254310.1 hypothetical protein [Chryseobacterium sp. H1D6B]